MSEDLKLNFYLVRNKEGNWFRSKGYGGFGSSWTDNVRSARAYARPGPAKAVSTWFARNHPSYGVPDVVRFEAHLAEVIDSAADFKKRENAREQRKRLEEARAAKRALEDAQRQVEQANRRLDEAKRKAGQT